MVLAGFTHVSVVSCWFGWTRVGQSGLSWDGSPLLCVVSGPQAGRPGFVFMEAQQGFRKASRVVVWKEKPQIRGRDLGLSIHTWCLEADFSISRHLGQ